MKVLDIDGLNYYDSTVKSRFSQHENLVYKNLLKTNSLSQTINGITWVVNDDGTVTANGTASANSDFRCSNFFLKKGSYIVNGCPVGGSPSTYDVYIYKGNGKGTGFVATAIARDYGTESSSNSFTIDSDDTIFYTCRIFSGVTVNNLVFKPMIRDSVAINAEYQQYVPNCEECASLLDSGGEHISPANDAVMTDICNVGASYYKFYTGSAETSMFSYPTEQTKVARLWDNNFTPQKDASNKYQMSCSTFTGILIYGITYENSAYNVAGENKFSPLAYKNTDLYNEICNVYTEDNLSYWSSQHLARYCVEHGYSFKPRPDLSNIQAGDIIFYNFLYANRPFYMQVSHSETVAYKINDTKYAVWECGDTSGKGPRLTIRNKSDIQNYAVLIGRLPRPNTKSLTYDNLIPQGEAKRSHSNSNITIAQYPTVKPLKAWKQYTLIAHIDAGNIANQFPIVYDGANETQLSLSYSGATKKPVNNIYVIPFIPREDISSIYLRMALASQQTTPVTNTIDFAYIAEGLVQNCSAIPDNFINGIGVLSDAIESASLVLAKSNSDTRSLAIYGGTDNTGAYIGVWGKNNPESGGFIELRASDGTNSNSLVAQPDGTLKWGGHDILTDEKTGTVVTKSISSAVSLSVSTAKTITSISLSAGTWVINGHVNITGTAANKIYCASITTTANNYAHSNEGTADIHSSGASSAVLNLTRILTVNATTTVYLCGYANAACTASDAHITAVRIV